MVTVSTLLLIVVGFLVLAVIALGVLVAWGSETNHVRRLDDEARHHDEEDDDG